MIGDHLTRALSCLRIAQQAAEQGRPVAAAAMAQRAARHLRWVEVDRTTPHQCDERHIQNP